MASLIAFLKKKGLFCINLFNYKKLAELDTMPSKVTRIYFLSGFLWIFITDNFTINFVENDITSISYFQSFKGWIYVAVTSWLLFFVLSKAVAAITDKENKMMMSYEELEISEKTLEKNMAEIERLAYYDSLTGLPNRELIFRKINKLIENPEDIEFSLLFIDLDNFKTVNDILGHEYGDQMLGNIGEKMKECIEKDDVIARLGGDEFLILKTSTTDKESLEMTAQKVLDIFSSDWSIEEKDFYITSSIGIVRYPEDGMDTHTLYKNADMAMYRVKENGKNGFGFYDISINKKIEEKLKMETSIRKAIKNEELQVYYQPQVDIKTMKIIGVEALVRWNHPTEGIIEPSKFIPFAEENGLIFDIDRIVMKTACKQMKEWQKKYKPIILSLNLTCIDIQKKDFVDNFKVMLNETGLEAEYLDLEITEDMVMKNFEHSIDVLNNLRDLGVRISLDDFGTGYSSLNYLKRLPIDSIKIDKSFVAEITEESKEEAIAQTIIALAHKMNLFVVAEGIETKKQLEFLEEQECDIAQGYYFNRPLPASEVEKILLM